MHSDRKLSGALVAVAGLAASSVGGNPPDLAPPAIETCGAKDRPDRAPGLYQVHVIYAVPADRPDREWDSNGTLASSLASAQGFFSNASSGIALRLDEQLDVTPDLGFLALPRLEGDYASEGGIAREAIQTDLLAAGFSHSRKIDLVDYDGTNPAACGGAPPLTTGDPVTVLDLHGLTGTPSACAQNQLGAVDAPAAYWDWATIHEVVHDLGFAAPCRPNHAVDRSAHTGDFNFYLIYAGPQAWQPTTGDSIEDDYFGANLPEGCERNLSLSAFVVPQIGDQLPVNFHSRVIDIRTPSTLRSKHPSKSSCPEGCVLFPPALSNHRAAPASESRAY